MWLKKVISRLMFPVPLGLELLVAGILIWTFSKRWRKLGQGLVIAGTLWMAAIGYPWASQWILPGLMRQYPPLEPKRVEAFQPRFIVVPGMGVDSETGYPANLRFPTEFVLRLIEAVRLHRLAPGSQILVSISNPDMTLEEKSAALSELLTIFGVDPQRATVLTALPDTEGEIEGFLEKAGKEPVCVVSSSANLPRAMMFARRHGLNAIASPSSSGGLPPNPDRRRPFSIVQIFPCAENVGATELGFYEGLGVTFERLKERMKLGVGPVGEGRK